MKVIQLILLALVTLYVAARIFGAIRATSLTKKQEMVCNICMFVSFVSCFTALQFNANLSLIAIIIGGVAILIDRLVIAGKVLR